MSKISKENLSKVHKPFDFVESKKGSFGYIQEVNINEGQDEFDSQVSYFVNWIKNVDDEKSSWWDHNDLIILGNMFKEIAKGSVHPLGINKRFIDQIM